MTVARKLRHQLPGYLRHVMSRGNGRMPIFLDDRDYRTFVHLLGETVEEFEIECWNYCVLPNHYHATLRPTLPNFSAAMHQLNGDYAQWWNRRHGRVGHTFQGRFKDQVVEREGYLLSLCRYVARNPVRAGLVERPEDWEWSSYAATIGLKPARPFVCTDSVLQLFGEDTVAKLQSRFAEFVLTPSEGSEIEDRFRSKEWILGDKTFKLEVRGEVKAVAEANSSSADESDIPDHSSVVSAPEFLMQA
jgi:REP element-mobilizing transposase RayT